MDDYIDTALTGLFVLLVLPFKILLLLLAFPFYAIGRVLQIFAPEAVRNITDVMDE